jgi:hypothetical protein
VEGAAGDGRAWTGWAGGIETALAAGRSFAYALIIA